MTAADLATLSRACGEMSFVPPGDWMAGFFRAAGEDRLRGEEFRAEELVDLGWGLSRMGRVHIGEEWSLGYLKVWGRAKTSIP